VAFQLTNATYWRDPLIHSLSEDGRILGIYLLTCAERRSEGFFYLPAALALDELSWTRERLTTASAELAKAGFAHYDLRAQCVFIAKGLKHHPPKSPSQIAGAAKKVMLVKDSGGLFWKFLEAADRYCPALADAIREQYPTIPRRDGHPTEGVSDSVSRDRDRDGVRRQEEEIERGDRARAPDEPSPF
jgi:hypothetical protein